MVFRYDSKSVAGRDSLAVAPPVFQVVDAPRAAADQRDMLGQQRQRVGFRGRRLLPGTAAGLPRKSTRNPATDAVSNADHVPAASRRSTDIPRAAPAVFSPVLVPVAAAGARGSMSRSASGSSPEQHPARLPHVEQFDGKHVGRGLQLAAGEHQRRPVARLGPLRRRLGQGVQLRHAQAVDHQQHVVVRRAGHEIAGRRRAVENGRAQTCRAAALLSCSTSSSGVIRCTFRLTNPRWRLRRRRQSAKPDGRTAIPPSASRRMQLPPPKPPSANQLAESAPPPDPPPPNPPPPKLPPNPAPNPPPPNHAAHTATPPLSDRIAVGPDRRNRPRTPARRRRQPKECDITTNNDDRHRRRNKARRVREAPHSGLSGGIGICRDTCGRGLGGCGAAAAPARRAR